MRLFPLLVVITLILVSPTVWAASNDVYLSVASGSLGSQTFSLNVNIDASDRIYADSFELEYPDNVEVIGVNPGTFLSRGAYT